MSTIPRLTTASEPLIVSLEINVNLLPYFQKWYQAAKQDGDTPETFAIRALKQQAMAWYAQREKRTLDEAIDVKADTDRKDLRLDSRLIINEV